MTGKAGRPKTLDPNSRMVTVPLPLVVVAALDKWAQESGMSRNGLIRQELEACVQRWRRSKKQ